MLILISYLNILQYLRIYPIYRIYQDISNISLIYCNILTCLISMDLNKSEQKGLAARTLPCSARANTTKMMKAAVGCAWHGMAWVFQLCYLKFMVWWNIWFFSWSYDILYISIYIYICIYIFVYIYIIHISLLVDLMSIARIISCAKLSHTAWCSDLFNCSDLRKCEPHAQGAQWYPSTEKTDGQWWWF